MKMIDVHAHLCDDAYAEDLQDVLARINDEMEACICASFDFLSSKNAVKLAEKEKKVFAAVGIHPENAEEFFDVRDDFFALCKREKVVAIGEIGLDYHYFSGKSNEEIEKLKKKQKEVFVEQIKIANILSLPIEVHCRDAMQDCLEILEKNPPKKPSLMHCFSGNIDDAERLMALDFSFSFGGITTFKNARAVQEVVRAVPLERIMLETDCPYLSPEPFRGKRNEPVNVKYVADKIAQLKGLTFENVADETTKNAVRMFKFTL